MANPNPSNKMKPGERKGGRKKGTPNKITTELKAMIEGALMAVGGQAYLEAAAEDHPEAFLTLLGKTLPKDMRVAANLKLEVNLVNARRPAQN